jgi:serine kinase of HPr protein (carbohydrate metabolism regulator)
MSDSSQTVHATTVALAGRAVLLRGAPGSGKSDLALRLVEEGAALVSDDQTRLSRRGAELWAAAPAPLKDMIEVRGIGIVRINALDEAPVALLIDLVGEAEMERLPEPQRESLLGVLLPRLKLNAAAASAPAKVRLALRLASLEGEPGWRS